MRDNEEWIFENWYIEVTKCDGGIVCHVLFPHRSSIYIYEYSTGRVKIEGKKNAVIVFFFLSNYLNNEIMRKFHNMYRTLRKSGTDTVFFFFLSVQNERNTQNYWGNESLCFKLVSTHSKCHSPANPGNDTYKRQRQKNYSDTYIRFIYLFSKYNELKQIFFFFI